MENATVTFDLGWLIAVVVLPVVGWQFKRMNDIASDLTNYKLEAVERFASVSHLQEVEKRLIDEIKGLRHDIRQLSNAMNILAARGPNIGDKLPD